MKKLKCELCNKKLKSLVNYPCKCGKYYCQIHKISKIHNCQYDYIGENKKLLKKNNERIVKMKVERIN